MKSPNAAARVRRGLRPNERCDRKPEQRGGALHPPLEHDEKPKGRPSLKAK
jgi:hypothetical protein